MTRIDMPCTTAIADSWVKQNHDQIERHAAWRNDLREADSETLLKSEAPFSYLLRRGEKEHAYFITFVKSDGTIKHQRFVLELDRKGWYYRNGDCQGPTLSETVEELIPLMMHCSPMDCRPLHA